jgi:glycosyltransferase involved in cell wall biosynthesis
VHEDAPGGIETLLASLITALGQLGCEQTLLASGESDTCARLLPVVETGLTRAMASGAAWEYGAYEQEQLLMALDICREFDVLHSHVGAGAYALAGAEGLSHRLLHTHHNDITPDLKWFVRRHPGLPLCVPSLFQARQLAGHGARRCWVVPNGIAPDRFPVSSGGPDLVFLGRIEFEKGADIAARVAHAMGRRLVVAGPIVDNEYFASKLEPLLGDGVRYIGPVEHARKVDLLGQAGCTLMPSRWDEPFGLVAIESMACGTPVVALPNGALPEVVDQGVTGYLGRAEAELPMLVEKALELDRVLVGAHMRRRFSIANVAERYLNVYEAIVAGR